MTIRTSFGNMYSRFGIDIERINLDPHNELDLVDDDRADMALAAAELYAQHAEDVLNATCPDAEFAVFPNGEISRKLGADLAPLEDNWESVREEIAMGPDAEELDDLLDYYADVAEVHITSPRLVANGVGAWSGTVEEYDAEVLQHDNRFHRVVLERAAEGVFGEDVAAMLEDGDEAFESRLPVTLSEVAQALSRDDLAEFCEHLFDDPNVTLG